MMVNCQFLLENVVKWFIYIYSTFVQVWPKGMKHHLFRTNNFHSAWRFLRFIFEHIYRHFSLHHGNKQKSIQMLHFYIAVLVTAAPLSWIFKKNYKSRFLLGPGLCFLLASKSGFSHRVNPYSLHMLKRFFFAIPHQLVQVNSWDIPNDSFRMRLIISYHIWSVYAPLFSYLEQISN